MDLHTVQLIFYILGIVFLSVMIFIAIFFALTLLFIKRKVTQLSDLIDQKVTKVTEIFDYKEEFASEMLAKGANMIMRRMGNIFSKKKKPHHSEEK